MLGGKGVHTVMTQGATSTLGPRGPNDPQASVKDGVKFILGPASRVKKIVLRTDALFFRQYRQRLPILRGFRLHRPMNFTTTGSVDRFPNGTKLSPEELLAPVDLVHSMLSQCRMQFSFQGWRILRLDHRMDIEPKWHTRTSEFVNTFLRIKAPSKADLIDVVTK